MACAQEAFMTSYVIAVTNNKVIFNTESTLNIATLSSRYILYLRRICFWAALPNLHTMKLNISPDWRGISVGARNLLIRPIICPSTAVIALSTFIRDFIPPLRSIKKLSLGWVDGGEFATGLFARNQHILCAPFVLQLALRHHNLADNIVLFPHVMRLTLTNCWMTPSLLEMFLLQHKNTLQVPTLSSVSLTVPTRSGLQATAGLNWSGQCSANLVSNIHSHVHCPES